MKTQITKGSRGERLLNLRAGTLDEAARSVQATLSTSTPVRTLFGDEVLSHAPGAVDLSRASPSLPLLASHDPTALVGRVTGVRLAGDELIGTLEFSANSERGRESFDDVRDGFLSKVSVGYRIHDFEPGDDDGYTVTRWELLEASVVAVPADAGASIHRSLDGMTDKIESNVTSIGEFQRTEQARRDELTDAFRVHLAIPGARDLRDECIADMACTVAGARERLLTLIGSMNAPIVGSDYRQAAHGGFHDAATYADVRGSTPGRGREFDAAAVDAILIRAGIRVPDPHPAVIDLREMSLSDMARSWYSQRGISTDRFSRAQLFTRAPSHGTSDFSLLLADVANKALRLGSESASASYRAWCQVTAARDFKTISRVGVGGYPALEQVLEGGEFKSGTMSEQGEQYALAKYGRLFGITREALINDDLGQFANMTSAIAAAMVRTKSDLVYEGVINANPVMSDGDALFHANHRNLATAAAMSVETVDELVQAVETQTLPAESGQKAQFADGRARFLIVPPSLRLQAQSIVRGASLELGAGGSTTESFTVEGADPLNNLEVVTDPRLGADGAGGSDTAFYVSASNLNSVELSYLDGTNEGESMDSEMGFDIDGITWKARLEAAAAPIDWRGIAKNAGA